MEEGGGSGLDELNRRLHAWNSGGRLAFEDLPGDHHRIGFPKNFVAPFPLQKTWAPLIRCLLSFRGEADATPARIRELQSNGLGTLRGDSVLAELLPMPSPGVAHWPYAELADLIPELKDRKTYTNALLPSRIHTIRAAIRNGKPKAIIFYGLGYLESWNRIAGDTLTPTECAGRSIHSGLHESIRYYAVPHPVAHGMTHAFWTELGATIRAAGIAKR